MTDYIIKMDLAKINPNPLNEQIYRYNPVEHKELKKSIELCGLLEPLTITKDNLLISGHRRFKVLQEIGYDVVDCRLSDYENLNITLVELNRYRKKSPSELLNEAEILKTEYSKMIKKGRPRNGEKREGKNWTILNVSERLGVSATNLKKLMSLKKYEPEMLDKVDMGLISIGKAYSIIRDKYILNEKGAGRKPNDFRTEYRVLLDKWKPTLDDVASAMNLNTDIWSQRVNGFDTNTNIREEEDYYPTHPKLTQLLLERENFTGRIWEPACGGGHMSEELIRGGYDVLSTEKYDRGYGIRGVDFLNDTQLKQYGKIDNIITNPPFKTFTEFVLQSKKYATKKVCVLGKTIALEGINRYKEIWTDKDFPLKTYYQFNGRVSFSKNEIKTIVSGTLMGFGWYVFEKGYKGEPKIKWIDVKY